MNNLNRRGPWSSEEDQKLMELISIFGPTNWVRISNNLVSRTPKQCRERYHQNLKPSLNRTPISQEEGELIEQLVMKYGKKWAEIARHLNGRSDNAIKNWWNGGASKRRRASLQSDRINYEEDPHVQPQIGQPQIHGQVPNVNGQNVNGQNTNGQQNFPPQLHMGQFPQNVGPVPFPNGYGFNPPQPRLGSFSGNLAPQISPLPQGQGQGQGPQGAQGLQVGNGPNGPSTNGTIANPIPNPAPNTISFNTSMFNSSPPEMSPKEKVSFDHNTRSASFDYSNQLPPLINKRRLFEDPLSLRRHSINNTNVHSHNSHLAVYNNQAINSSHPNLSTASITSSNGNGSPLYSTNNSRNNSISTMDNLNFYSNSNSNVNSRRSSIAPDLFPNPLSHKRNISSNSIKVTPLNQLPTGLPSSAHLTNLPLNPPALNSAPISFNPEENGTGTKTNMSNVITSDKDKVKTKIKVSSLID